MANRPDYVGYTHDQLLNKIDQDIRDSGLWTNLKKLFTSTYRVILNAITFGLDMIIYIIERVVDELYVETAKKRSSLVNLGRLINYDFNRKTSAITTIRFYMTDGNPASMNVVIPQYTSMQTQSGIEFLTTEASILPAGNTSVDISSVIQGTLKTETFTSNGQANQEFTILNDSVENTHIDVIVTYESVDTLWSRVEVFGTAAPNDEVYKIENLLEGNGIKIKFGDGIFGKIPPLGSTITVKYVESLGSDGNVYETDVITTLNTQLYYSDSSPADVSVTNTEYAVGGADMDDTEQIRVGIENYAKSVDMLQSREDWLNAIKNYPGVHKANVWGEFDEYSNPEAGMLNKVKISLILDGNQEVTNAFKEALLRYIYPRRDFTTDVLFEDAVILYLIWEIDAKIEKVGVLEDARTSIQSNIYNYVDEMDIGDPLMQSDYISVIDGSLYVSSHHTSVHLKQYVYDDSMGSVASLSGTLNMNRCNENTMYVYKIDASDPNTVIELCHDDGTGILTGTGASGYITYTTGDYVINLNENADTGDQIWVKYDADDNGDIVCGYSQAFIVDVNDMTINLEYVS